MEPPRAPLTLEASSGCLLFTSLYPAQCSKLFISFLPSRPYSSGDETLSSGADFSGVGVGGAGGDFETQLQVAQETTTMMTQMHYINEICWDTCITGNPGSSLSSRESNCLSNCVERFVDTTLLITNRSDI